MYPSRTISISVYPKMMWQFIFVLPLILRYNKLQKIDKWFLLYAFGLLILGVVNFSSDRTLFFSGLKHYNKLILPFFVYLFIARFNINIQKGLKALDIIFLINAIVIFVGFVFEIEYLKSYPFTTRFGYSGIFSRYAINDVSLFYLIGNFYFFARWYNGETTLLLFLVVVMSSFLVGTKAIYLQNIFLLSYIILKEPRYRIVAIITIILASLLIFTFYNFDFWEQLYRHKGVLAVLTSLRTELIMERIPLAWCQITLKNFVIGFNQPFKYFVEMDLIDLILTLGVVGATILIKFYFKILFNFKKENHYARYFVAVFFIMILISGRYTYSGLNAVYFPLFVYYLKNGKEYI